MFSQTVEYALRAMTQLADDVPGGYTTQFIAKKTDVPAAYLAKVLQGMKLPGSLHHGAAWEVGSNLLVLQRKSHFWKW